MSYFFITNPVRNVVSFVNFSGNKEGGDVKDEIVEVLPYNDINGSKICAFINNINKNGVNGNLGQI